MLQTIAAVPDTLLKHNKDSQPTVRSFRITWHGSTYAVTNVSHYRAVYENGRKMHLFTATDGKGTFELKFSDEDMEWFLGI